MSKESEKVSYYLKNYSIDIQQAKAAFFGADLVFRSYADSSKITGVKFAPVMSYFIQGSNFWQLLLMDKIKEVGQKIYQDYLKNLKSLSLKMKQHQSLELELDQYWVKYQNLVKTGSSAELLRVYKKLKPIFWQWWYYGVIGEDKGKIVNDMVVPIFERQRHLNQTEAEELVSLLAHPKEAAAFSLERQLFLEICLLVAVSIKDYKAVLAGDWSALKNNKNLSNKILKYQRNFFYKATDFYEAKELTLAMILDDVKVALKKDSAKALKKELAEMILAQKSLQRKKQSLLKKLKLTKEEKKLIQFAGQITLWIDQRKVGMMKQLYYLYTLLRRAAEVNHLPYAQAALYVSEELERLLATGVAVDAKTIKLRQKAIYEVCWSGKDYELFYGQTAKELFSLAQHVIDQTAALKGSVACRGSNQTKKIKGKVKIVLHPQADQFKSGDILVTSMTRIEFVSIMKKAKAIITDEGGIACHAAIISREFGIPCIIGTKTATRQLKDGDVVEIDTDNGVIKIIK